MRRPSSINEDILCRRYSTFVDPDEDDASSRVQSALESLSLLDPIDLHDPPTKAYGAIPNNKNDLLESITIKYENNNNNSITTETALLKKEIKAMIQLAIPVILTYVLELVPGIITLVLVGRMDNTTISNNHNRANNNNKTATDEHHEQFNHDIIHSSSSTKLYVDAAALAVMFFNIIGLSTGQGILTALDTLCASAHGANQSSKMGRYLLTATIIMMCMLLLVSVILVNTTPILIALGQPIEVSQQAGIFVYYMLPGLPFLYIYELVRKPSQANHQTLPMICAAIVGLLVTCSTGYYMVNYTSLGWVGAALARTLGYIATVPTVCVGMYYTETQFVIHVYNGMIYKEAVTKEHIIILTKRGESAPNSGRSPRGLTTMTLYSQI